ncbi:hypothetical protein [Acetobacter conturbans]|uniref:DUF2510 domain-containing protein n=1 Tax=Acetobacter conturbans TaxID=1737472 RepID=A0ABX0JZQ5_9PROT|nr:hypothetical protein [Acetobacter conturbans]NHN88889.1 hypothetical protein [Acetobacter conturbans]
MIGDERWPRDFRQYSLWSEESVARTGQKAASLLAALALTGCYEQYNYRPAHYQEGWSFGSHGGHAGWFDQRGHWQGWFDGSQWHDAHPAAAHEKTLPNVIDTLRQQSAQERAAASRKTFGQKKSTATPPVASGVRARPPAATLPAHEAMPTVAPAPAAQIPAKMVAPTSIPTAPAPVGPVRTPAVAPPAAQSALPVTPHPVAPIPPAATPSARAIPAAPVESAPPAVEPSTIPDEPETPPVAPIRKGALVAKPHRFLPPPPPPPPPDDTLPPITSGDSSDMIVVPPTQNSH